MDEQYEAATQRVRKMFLDIKDNYARLNVREPAIGALIGVLIHQEIRIENLEAAIRNSGNAPSMEGK